MIKFNPQSFLKEPRLKLIESQNYNLDILMNKETDIIYSAGSVIEGYGDKFSDVDIYFLCENMKLPTDYDIRLPEAGTKIGFNVFSNEDYGFYVEFILNSKLWAKNILKKINSLTTNDEIAIYELRHREIDFYYRLSNSVPIYNEDLYSQIVSDASINHIRDIISVNNMVRCKIHLSYANLLYEEKEYEQAYYFAQDAVNEAIDSYLAKNKEAYQSFKLRYRKLERAFGKESDIYKKCVNMSALGNNTLQNYILKAFDLCKDLGIEDYKSIVPTLKYKINGEIVFFSIFEDYMLFNGNELYTIDKNLKIIIEKLKGHSFTEKNINNIVRTENIQNDFNAKNFLEEMQKYGIIKLDFEKYND